MTWYSFLKRKKLNVKLCECSNDKEGSICVVIVDPVHSPQIVKYSNIILRINSTLETFRQENLCIYQID